MRLIDADKFILSLNVYIDKPITAGLCATLIHLFPTAYDIDKVMEELEKLQKETFSYAFKYNDDFYNGQASGLEKAIEIVKKQINQLKESEEV